VSCVDEKAFCFLEPGVEPIEGEIDLPDDPQQLFGQPGFVYYTASGFKIDFVQSVGERPEGAKRPFCHPRDTDEGD
jgi:hypothetical protein